MFRYLFALVVCAGLITGCGQGATVDVPENGVIKLSDQFTGDFELIDMDGEPYSSVDAKGRFGVVYFGFATCPDVCPLALGTLSAALNELNADEREKLRSLFITVDPERDTPEVMKVYLSSFHEDIIGLTGSVESVNKATESFKVYAAKAPLEGSALEYSMDHTSLFYVVDGNGTPKFALRDTLSPTQLAAALRKNLR